MKHLESGCCVLFDTTLFYYVCLFFLILHFVMIKPIVVRDIKTPVAAASVELIERISFSSVM